MKNKDDNLGIGFQKVEQESYKKAVSEKLRKDPDANEDVHEEQFDLSKVREDCKA